MERTAGQPVIGGHVAEEVEGERGRPEEVRPQPLVIEALVALDERRARLRGGEGGRREERGARLARVVERETAPDRPRRLTGTRRDRARSDRMAVRLAPLRLLMAHPLPELGHRRPPG